jgi:hypothetical protein
MQQAGSMSEGQSGLPPRLVLDQQSLGCNNKAVRAAQEAKIVARRVEITRANVQALKQAQEERLQLDASIKSMCAEKQRLLTEDVHAATAGYEAWIMSEANGQLRPDEPQQGGAGGLVTKVAVFYADADGQKHIGALNDYKHYPQVSHGRYCNFDARHYIPNYSDDPHKIIIMRGVLMIVLPMATPGRFAGAGRVQALQT